MLSTRASDYALRGMVYLARQSSGRLSMAGEIAAAENMPEHFFSKIFQNLAKSGLVNSFRGSNGGFALARSPEDIRILDVIEAIDGPVCASKCTTAPESCERSGSCPFRLYWQEAEESVLSVLKKYSVADAANHVEMAESKV